MAHWEVGSNSKIHTSEVVGVVGEQRTVVALVLAAAQKGLSSEEGWGVVKALLVVGSGRVGWVLKDGTVEMGVEEMAGEAARATEAEAELAARVVEAVVKEVEVVMGARAGEGRRHPTNAKILLGDRPSPKPVHLQELACVPGKLQRSHRGNYQTSLPCQRNSTTPLEVSGRIPFG